MGFIDDLKSGKFYTYASWCGILSIAMLWIFCIVNIVSSNIIFAAVGLVISVAMLFLEIPFCTYCCSGPMTEKFQKIFANSLLRAFLYLAFAIIMWLHLVLSVSTLIIPSITLTVTSALYATAMCKKEDPLKKPQGQQPQQDQARLV